MRNAFGLITVCCIVLLSSCGNLNENSKQEPQNIIEQEIVEQESLIEKPPSPDVTEVQVEKNGETTEVMKEEETKPAEKEDEVQKTKQKEITEAEKAPVKPSLVSTVSEKPSSDNKIVAPSVIKPVTPPVKNTAATTITKPMPTTTPSKPTPPATKPAPVVPEKPASVAFSHDAFDQLLRKYVSGSGDVDYAGFKKDKEKLVAYLIEMEAFAPKTDWGRNKEMAYWINLYNAWMIKAVIDKYPIASPMDLDGGNTWKVKRAKSGREVYSLDEIENKIIRPKFKDARIHFAVNCAAKSCPPLLNRAWTASNLESNLEKQTKAFINDSRHNSISSKKVRISQIFQWYADDFGELITYLNKYSNTKINNNAKIEYIDYDWELNGK